MTDLNSNIKKWYRESYKLFAEEEGFDSVIDKEAEEDLEENITFGELYERMKNKEYIYDIIGDVDSVVREKIMAKLADILGVEYDVIFKLYLNHNK